MSANPLTQGFNQEAGGFFGLLARAFQGGGFSFETFFNGFIALLAGGTAGLTAMAMQPYGQTDNSSDDIAVETSAVTSDIEDFPSSLQGQEVTFWGDSIANSMGRSLNGAASVNNQGVDGRRLGQAINEDGVPLGRNGQPLSIDNGEVVVLNIGTNDVLNLNSSSEINSYAARVAEATNYVRAQGGVPVVVGVNSVDAGGYTGNSAFGTGEARTFNSTVAPLNTALRNATEGTALFVSPQGLSRSNDGLHTNPDQIINRINQALEQYQHNPSLQSPQQDLISAPAP